MNDFFLKEAAFSLLDLLREKQKSILILGPKEDIEVICYHTLSFFEAEVKKINSDPEDFYTLRSHFDGIMDLFCLFEASISGKQVRWAADLIQECYEICGMKYDHRLLLLVEVSNFSDYSVIPNALRLFPPKLTNIIFKDIKKPLDIFQIPIQVSHDLISVALVAHEVGHVLWDSQREKVKDKMFSLLQPLLHEKENELKEEIDKHADDLLQLIAIKKKEDLASELIQQFEHRMANYIEEYFCDEIGRELLGPAFDLAFVKNFGPVTPKSSDQILYLGNSHPSEISRIQDALFSLKSYQVTSEEYSEGFSIIFSECLKTSKDATDYNKIDEEDHAKSISNELIRSLKPKNNNLFSSSTLDVFLTTVFHELDGFRPPFESVNDQTPNIICPRQSVVGTTIYFYGEYYKNGRYFKDVLKSAEIDPKNAGRLRKTLTRHLQYAISLYNFVKVANMLILENPFDKETLSKTLWPARSNPLRVGEDPFVVTPTIDPTAQYGSNSVDLRLGSAFLIHKPTRYTNIPSRPKRKGQRDAPIEAFYEDIFIPIGEDFVLHPHQFVLASTLEYLCLPKSYYALVLGRSSWGRLGLNIATATTVQAGFCGCLTLELRNLGESPLILIPGTRIAQICLIEVPRLRGQPAELAYLEGNSKYIGPIGPEIPKMISKDRDWRILKIINPSIN